MTLSAADFELLLQANRILSSKLDTAEVLQAVMELATKVVRAEASSLLLLDESKQELYFDVALGSVKESVKQIRLKVGEGVAGWVAKERRPLIVNDVTQDKRFSMKADKSTSFKTKSILAVPLLSKGKLIGVVEAINKEHMGQFSGQDQEAFEVFGSQAAVAIENARLFSEVTREKEKLSAIFTEMSDGILLLDGAQRIVFANAAAQRFFGAPADKIIGRVFNAGFLPDFESTPPLSTVPGFNQKITTMDLSRRAGKDFMLSALFLQLQPDDKNEKQGHLVIVRDVTEERRGEMLKRNFLSLISHKLKTPLTVIVGYAPVLASQTEGLSEPQKKAIKSICDQGENLNGLVDKLLRFTIAESESLERKIELTPVAAFVLNATKSISSDIGPSLKIHVDASVDQMPDVPVDGSLMTDVFKNLIENAVKFNDKKEKEISVFAEKRDGEAVITVRDNGIGIPPEEKEKVFQKFYQVENSFTGQIPGAGLGLSLCKKVVEAMGGSISIESEIGKGTDVRVKLPMKKKATPRAC